MVRDVEEKGPSDKKVLWLATLKIKKLLCANLET